MKPSADPRHTVYHSGTANILLRLYMIDGIKITSYCKAKRKLYTISQNV